jgi:SHS2 domain-containing protein
MAMFAYMTDIETVDNLRSEQIQAQGHDLLSLLYGFLDEFLFLFSAEPYFIARKVVINSFDRENFKIVATGYGETFDLSKHPQGTEVKAITYSNMQVHEDEGYAEVFVIIDI